MDYSFCEAKGGWGGGWEAWTEPGSSEVGCSQPAALIGFLSPVQVVRPGLLSGYTLDEILQVPPETQPLQRVVQPTWRDKAQWPICPTLIPWTEAAIAEHDLNLYNYNKRQTRSDAEVRLMRRDVVDAVVLAGEDDLAVLEEHNPTRQANVCVRPLVNLVG